MVKRLFLALLALVTAQAAIAQNQKPPDVPTPSGPTVATYAAGTTMNKLGPTGTATTPDTPAYFSSMPPDYPTPNRADWLFPNPAITEGSGSFENCGNLTVNCEAKFRSHLADGRVGYDDPIRNYGQPGTSHCHIFFGNPTTNAYSTFQSLRLRGDSFAVGGMLNRTGYWAPCLIDFGSGNGAFGDGKQYAVRMNLSALYYVDNNAISAWLIRLPRGLRYVGGVNMDDPENTTRRREIVVANAQSGTAGRYSIIGNGNGFNGWQCISGDGVQATPMLVPHLKNPNGTDPFGGTCSVGTGANAGKPAMILADFDGPGCWQGKDPWVPGGYNHVRYKINDTQLNSSKGERACPDTWYHIPAIRLEANFYTEGWTDYQNWRLSSDDALQAKLNSLPTCTTDATGAYANAPCATRSAGGPLGAYWNGTSYVVANGASFHTDWFGAWDDETLRTWLANCVGVQGLLDGAGNPLPSTPHTCASSVIKAGMQMLGGTPPLGANWPSGHNPIIDMNRVLRTTTPSQMFRIRTVAPSGTHDVHVH